MILNIQHTLFEWITCIKFQFQSFKHYRDIARNVAAKKLECTIVLIVFRAVRGNRKILMERADLQRARCKYLRAIREERKTKNMVYLDETWVNATHTPDKECVSEDGTR